jgi:hypothetical protein
MFSSPEFLYFAKIFLNNAAICVSFNLSKDSILQKHLPKTKFKQFFKCKLFRYFEILKSSFTRKLMICRGNELMSPEFN